MQKNEGLTNQVYEIIKKKLISCEYKPNTMLNETQLSNEMGYSRTPIREAIIKLAGEGFLQVIPKKGIYVTAITVNEIMQVFQTRREIEPIALKMGINNLDEDVIRDFKNRFADDAPNVLDGYKLDTAMHMYLVESCRNLFIINMMHSVFDNNTRIIITSKENQLHVNESRKEHLEILNDLLDRNYDQACAKLATHIDHCRSAALDSFYSTNAEFTQKYRQYLE